MQTLWKRIDRWLLPAVVILFTFQAFLMPLAVGLTYSDRPESPEHALTYKKNKLTWDSNTVVRADGTGELRLFDKTYDNTVNSERGDDVIAPGTTRTEFIRLNNTVGGSISYTAILYKLEKDGDVPLEASLTGNGFTTTTQVTLPDGVKPDQVVRAVKGTVKGKQFQDFDINWHWRFEDPADVSGGDAMDTDLGNAEDLAEVTLGFYIVVEDNNSYHTANPKTGDDFKMAVYVSTMALSGGVLLALLVHKAKSGKREQD